jgi:hypothetical protein
VVEGDGGLMAYAINDTISFIATFRNPDGSAATGVSVTAFSKDAYTKAGATITFPTLSAFAEIGVTGRYKATAVALAAGSYTVVARATGAYLFPDYECGPFEVVTESQSDPFASLIAADVEVNAPIDEQDNIELIAGQDVTLSWDSSGWDDLTGDAVTFQVYKVITDDAVFTVALVVTVSDAGEDTQTVSLTVDADDTALLKPGVMYRYEVIAEDAGLLVHGALSARGS